MRFLRGITLLLIVLASIAANADSGTIRLNLLPGVTVADSRSTVTISAYVYRSGGQPVPDGTQVLFETTKGTIKGDDVVQTQNGIARAVLQTGSDPGTATIKASALAFNAISTTEIEFLSDRSLLSSANEYVEVVAPGYMVFSMDQRVLGAAGPDKGAHLRYREIAIDADDLQLNIPNYEVRAKKAHLRIGKFEQDFDQLYIKLPARKGAGLAVVEGDFTNEDGVVERRKRLSLVTVRSTSIELVSGTEGDPGQFMFEDLSESTSLISAKKAVVFPRKEIQFQKAEVMVGGVKVMKLPLFQVSLNTASPVVTDQILNINDNQLNINYPYYLTLKPGQTSLLRLSTGNKYGRTGGIDGGISLDYELAWNRGDDFDGGLTISSIGKNNWGLSARQYVRFDERSTGLAFLEMPGGRSLFGSAQYSRQFDGGYGLNISGSGTRSFGSSRFANQQMAIVFAKDPMKLGKLPIRWSYGLNASASSTSVFDTSRSQEAAGIHLRTQLMPQKFDRSSTLNASITLGEQFGRNTTSGLTMSANASLARNLGKVGGILLSYDFRDNGLNSGLTGRHQLGLQGNFNVGKLSSTFSTLRSLDVPRMSVFADFGYRLNNSWRLSYSYTYDRYFSNTYVDYNAAIGYQLGWREIGLTFSGRTKRFGIQLLGAALN